MPRYLLSVHGPAERPEWGTDAVEVTLHAFADTGAFNERLQKDGHLVFAGGLESATTATTVDGLGEKPAFTDGPYQGTQDCLGGLWVIEAADLDVALALAVEASKACGGAVEVRPFQTVAPVRPLPEP